MNAEMEKKLALLEERAGPLKGLLDDIETMRKSTRYPDVDVKLRLADISEILGDRGPWLELVHTCRKRFERNPGNLMLARDFERVLEHLVALPWMMSSPPSLTGLEFELGQVKELIKTWEEKNERAELG